MPIDLAASIELGHRAIPVTRDSSPNSEVPLKSEEPL